MRSLVIGAGHVGRRVIAMWRSRGEVFATTRTAARAADLEALGARPIVCDVTSPTELPEVDVALWCVGHDRGAPAGMRDVYVDGLAKTLANLNTARLVYTSSTGVYGSRAGDEVDETSPTEPDDPSGAIVLEAERVLRGGRPDAIVLRLAGLYGPDRWIGRAALEAGAALDGDPERWLNLIHEEDAAWAVVLAADFAADGALYNVADDEPVRRRAYYEALARAIGAAPPRFTGGASGSGRRVRADRIRAELGFRCYHQSVGKCILTDPP
jgi:nucleoside-diphosphate-sugar epimerase